MIINKTVKPYKICLTGIQTSQKKSYQHKGIGRYYRLSLTYNQIKNISYHKIGCPPNCYSSGVRMPNRTKTALLAGSCFYNVFLSNLKGKRKDIKHGYSERNPHSSVFITAISRTINIMFHTVFDHKNRSLFSYVLKKYH